MTNKEIYEQLNVAFQNLEKIRDNIGSLNTRQQSQFWRAYLDLQNLIAQLGPEGPVNPEGDMDKHGPGWFTESP